MSLRYKLAGLLVMLTLLICQRSVAQDSGPAPDAPAIAASQFSEAPLSYETTASGSGRRPRLTLTSEAYYSPNLKAHFKAQWVYITQRGRQVEFWGARIISLDHHSPLRDLRVNPGDVVTRLDGIPIWTNMYKEQGRPWQLVQLEQHYGRTEVRYILRGTDQVRVGDMMLDGTIDEGFEDAVPVPP